MKFPCELVVWIVIDASYKTQGGNYVMGRSL
jgi:hypothetical protein